MEPKDLSGLPAYSGLFYDPDTGMTYKEDGTETGFTFERATWTGPFGIHFQWPWLNPIGFATRETGRKVLAFCKGAAPKGLAVNLDESNRIVGPFTRTIERLIVVTDGDKEESYSAGWLAHSLIRNGEQRAATHWLDELKQVRFKT